MLPLSQQRKKIGEEEAASIVVDVTPKLAIQACQGWILKESPKRKKRCFGVWVEVGYYKHNQPAIYKGFSKDAGPPVVGPNDTDRIVFGTGVRIHCFDEPSPDGLTTEREENVSKEEDLILKKSEWSDFGLKNKKSRVKGWTNPPKKKTWYEFLGQAQAVSD